MLQVGSVKYGLQTRLFEKGRRTESASHFVCKVRSSKLKARSSKPESLKLEARSSKLEARSSKLEARSSKLEARRSLLEARSTAISRATILRTGGRPTQGLAFYGSLGAPGSTRINGEPGGSLQPGGRVSYLG